MIIQMVKILLLAAGAAMALASCSEATPTNEDLRSGLGESIPSYAQIISFEVQVSQNLRDDVEPLIKSRIRTNIQINQDLFVSIGKIEGRALIKLVVPRGNSREIHYIAESTLYKGKWRHRFRPQGTAFYSDGSPRLGFGQNAVVENSEEHKEIIRKREAEKQRIDALIKESKFVGEVTFDSFYRGIGYKYSNGMICGKRGLCIDQRHGISKNHIVDNSKGRSNFWYGNLTRIVHFGVRDNVGIFDLEMIAYNTIPGFNFYFNSRGDMDLFVKKLIAAHAAWRKKNCPESGAFTCRVFTIDRL